MASEEDKYKGYRPYFDQADDLTTNPPLKEVSLMPSTVETIDYAIYDWLNETADIFCTTNEGWKKVPIVWSMAERAHQIKSSKESRDKKGLFTLPVLVIERTSLVKDPQMKGVAWSHIPPYNDPRGGAIEVARRIGQHKTGNFANAESQRRFGQKNFPFDNKKIVYETVTMPIPVYVVANYSITIRTEYQQQMNEIFTPFMTSTGQINNFFITRDGHKFEGFIQGDLQTTNNISNLQQEERKFETQINIKVLAYLLGAANNADRPKVAVRENAVEFKIQRERVIFGDIKDYK